jgi:hypothetical protein
MIRFTEHLENVTTNNYDDLTELHTPKVTVATAHTKEIFSVFRSRCLVAAPNGGHPPSSGFPKYPRPQIQQLPTSLLAENQSE